MDKIEQFIKKNKGCPLTPAATKQLLTKFMEFLNTELPDMIEEGSGTSLKEGDYFYNEETGRFEWAELFPDKFTGFNLYIATDVIGIYRFDDGVFTSGIDLSYSGDIVATGRLEGKSLVISEPSYKYEFEIEPSVSGLTKIGSFGRIEVIGGELHIIAVCTYKNETGASVSNVKINQLNLTIPENIGSKIYDMNGKNLTEATSSPYGDIRIVPVGVRSGNAQSVTACRLLHRDVNIMQIYQQTGGVPVSAGDEICFSFEANLSIV